MELTFRQSIMIFVRPCPRWSWIAWLNCSVVVPLRLPPSTTARISPSSNCVSIDRVVFIVEVLGKMDPASRSARDETDDDQAQPAGSDGGACGPRVMHTSV